MSEIGAFEAKTHFSELLARAAAGEEFVITLRGRAVARLVPLAVPQDSNVTHATVAQLRRRAASVPGLPRGWTEWRGFRDEGRR